MTQFHRQFWTLQAKGLPLQCLERSFVWTSGVILLLTAFGKAMATVGYSDILLEPAPVFPSLTYRQVLFIASLIEFTVAFAIFAFLPIANGVWTITGIATIFVLYRTAVWLSGYDRPCGCLGSLAQALPVSETAASSIIAGVLAYLWLGGVLLAIGGWLSRKRSLNGNENEISGTNKHTGVYEKEPLLRKQ